ncbi:DUF3152 domain-containing protein [Streptomyces sp. NPDC058671]|uniref:DUF3152 domain-containing protein n=1 Tax=Streptomyces sp. NPDC058671 TaxID=3346590 RepID=UPI003652F83B
MGRHSRKGSAPSVADTGQQTAAGRAPATPGTPGTASQAAGRAPGPGRRRRTTGGGGGQETAGTPAYGTPAHGTPVYGTPAHGTPVYGTPAHGTPAHPAPSYGGGVRDTPAHGTPGTPAHGTPVFGSTVRGGHPQHDESSAPTPQPYGHRHGSRRRAAEPEADRSQAPFIPGPRHEDDPEADAPTGLGGMGRTLTGVAAAAIATVLAVIVTGQVTDRGSATAATRAAEQPADRAVDDSTASRSEERAAPTRPAPVKPPAPTYEQLIARQFPIDPKLKGSGEFKAVPGRQKAPGKGRLVRYRIDIEEGLGLDQELFTATVFKTLNDPRSWAGRGAMTFERVSSGEPDFVLTLASPGTTGTWCAKSGLDTTIDNVSCDSAATDRVMINAFRWAQGSETFGPKAMLAYRQMLINHEVGHRLGHGHVNCSTPGALAPVMQQQTKSLDIGGIKCRANPWVYPGS